MISILLFGAVVAATFYYFFVRPLSYWKKRGIKQTNPVWFFGDSWGMLGLQSITDTIRRFYGQPGDGRYVGGYQFMQPVLLIRDPNLTKQIMIKDFDHFVDHYIFRPNINDPLWSKNLIVLKGQEWREMRMILSPCFTSSKMRAMFSLMKKCAERFNEHFLSLNQEVVSVEMKDTFTRYATDVIASIAFGIDVDSLSNRENDFFMMGKKASNFTFWRAVKMFMGILLPKMNEFFGFKFFDDEMSSFFINLVEDSIRIREEKGLVRPDMIHLLMEARKGKNKIVDDAEEDASFAIDEKLLKNITNIDIAAQAVIFFFAGFETVSNLMTFMAYELAVNVDVQVKLRREIEETLNKHNNQLTYEALQQMKYMDMVVSETLRKWPVNLATDRLCTKAYTIEPVLPGEKPLHLEAGAAVNFLTFAIHRDPQYFPDPEKFNPERFSSENVEKIKPFTYLPFGGGPRICIGNRLALLETKVVFFHLLNNFEVVLTQKSNVPIDRYIKSVNLAVKGGVWLGFKTLKKNT